MTPPEPTELTPPRAPAVPGPGFALSLRRAAGLIFWGTSLLGLVAAARILSGGSDGPGPAADGVWLSRCLSALYAAGVHGLAGMGLGALILGLERWLRIQEREGDASREAPGGLSSRLEAVATALAAAQPDSGALRLPPVSAVDAVKEQSAAGVRRAIRERDWSAAADLLDAFSRDYAGDSHVSTLEQEHQAARTEAIRDHTAQIDAAREVNDPERVLELHQAMIPLLDAEARASLEADLSQWFLRLIHKRLRTGKIQTDVAVLAGRIAEAFSHTVEGASLRASLPTLRRSAGLCPRCSQPYTGVAAACPTCIAAARSPDRPADSPGLPES
jgi:hypothetical protein